MPVNINQLESPKSRAEAYLHFICGTGKIININQLPIPKSRIEWLLLFLCENLGNIGGGGGGQPFNGVTNVTYNAQAKQLQITYSNGLINNLDLSSLSGITDIEFDETTRTLKKIIEGQEEDVVSGLVTQWGDLEYIIEHKIANIFNEGAIIDSQHHHANGVITPEPEWCRYEIPCKPNEVISIAKKIHDSKVITFLNSSGNRVVSDNFAPKSVNGWQHYIITVPNNNDIEKVSINIYKPHNPLGGNSVMIYKGDKEPTKEYYPFANGYNVIVDGSKVSLTFDPAGSNLSSLTTHDAIIELDKKIVNVNDKAVKSVNGVHPQTDGNVTVKSVNIEYDGNASNINAANVQDAIDALKRDVNLLNGSTIYIVEDNQALTTLLGQNRLQKGDLIYIINSNGVVDYAGHPADGGNPVAMIYDSDLQQGNNLRVFSKFNQAINVSANVVTYDDRATNLGAANVQEAIERLKDKTDTTVTSVEFNGVNTLNVTTNGQLQPLDLSPLLGIKSINGEEGTAGEINLTTTNTTDSMEFKVENRTFATLNFMTDQEADAIIAGFTL